MIEKLLTLFEMACGMVVINVNKDLTKCHDNWQVHGLRVYLFSSIPIKLSGGERYLFTASRVKNVKMPNTRYCL